MLGTKDFALPTFRRLCESGHEVLALVTQPDRPQGRKQQLIPAPIKVEAIARGIAVHQPEDLNATEGVELLRSLAPDLLVTAAYGQILSPAVLGVAPMGGINLHGSILPRYRGAAPVARAIQAGDLETGVTVIQMSPRVDAGGMIAFARTPIGPNETSAELEARLADLGAPLIADVVDRLTAGTVEILPQDPTQATRAPKLRKEEGLINWSLPARSIHNLVRAMQPWPTCSTTWHPAADWRSPARLILHATEPVEGPDGEPGRVAIAYGEDLAVACGEGALRLLTVQMPGKKAVSVADLLRGYPVAPGDQLGPD
jgi:methionyl-tRNA formyltransferase